MKPFSSLADRSLLEKTVKAVEARGIIAELVETRLEALSRLKELIPPGSAVMTGASATLKEVGFEAELADQSQIWNYLKPGIFTEKDSAKRLELRRQAILADYFVGSVQAVAETGELVAASGSGSQLAPYVYSSAHIVWIVGGQKIVPDLEAALRRVREYCVPKVAEMAREMGRPELGALGKILIFEREMPYTSRNINLIIVNEALGF
jgi:L-lactate utilization protein LutB